MSLQNTTAVFAKMGKGQSLGVLFLADISSVSFASNFGPSETMYPRAHCAVRYQTQIGLNVHLGSTEYLCLIDLSRIYVYF